MTVHPKMMSMIGRRVLVDGVRDDAIGLTEFLLGRSARVTVLARGAIPPDVESRLGRHGFAGLSVRVIGSGEPIDLGDAQVVFVDLFTSARDPLVLAAREKGLPLSNLADLVVRSAPERSIGITGSAGKTTTTYLLAAMLRAAGIPARASTDDRLTPSGPGHDMLAALDSLGNDTWRVVELTSHHLDHVSVSPRIGIVTNFFPDHQDWHGSLGAYRDAKQRLLAFQGRDDLAILNFDDPTVRTEFARGVHGRTTFFSMSDEIEQGVVVSGGNVALRSAAGLRTVCALADLAMPAHHVLNALAASAAALELGAEITAVREVLRGFDGLPQRRQLIGTAAGVAVYDDTIAMNPRKALSGLETFPDRSLVVVCGGAVESPGGEQRVSSDFEKEDLRRFCTALGRKARGVVLFGAGGRAIRRVLDASGEGPAVIAEAVSFRRAAEEAIALAKPDGAVLIAPVFYSPPAELRRELEEMLGAEPSDDGLRGP